MNGFGFNSNGFVRQFLDKPIASYTIAGNKEVVISAVDVDTDTFTSAGHGLSNNAVVYFTINNNAGAIYPIKLYPGGVTVKKYHVVNKTDNTFQLSETSGGSAIAISANADMDLTKYHLEAVVTEVSFTNLPADLYACRIVINGRIPIPGAGAFILPNNISTSGEEWCKNGGTTYVIPDLTLGHDVSLHVEIMLNAKNYLTINAKGLGVKSNNASANIHTLIDTLFVSPVYVNTPITSIKTTLMRLANGSTVEVYKA